MKRNEKKRNRHSKGNDRRSRLKIMGKTVMIG